MTYLTTITKKGQVTIPKKIRDNLKLNKFQKLIVEMEEDGRGVRIRPSEDFLTLAKKAQIKKKTDPLKIRESLEKSYERQ